MIELVRDNSGVLIRQRADDAHVGHVAGGENQRLFAAGERRELLFQRLVLGPVAGDQVRGAAAHAVLRRGFRGTRERRPDAARARGSRCCRSRRRRRASVDAPRAPQVALLEVGERRLQRCRVALHAAPGAGACARASSRGRARARRSACARSLRAGGEPRGGTSGSMPRRANSARSRATSGIARGQQLLAVENRVRAGEETQRLQLVAHLLAAGRQAHVCLRHHDARDGDRAHEVERIHGRGARERRARHAHELVDRHALRMLRQVRERREHRRAIAHGFAHADDAAAAHVQSRRRARRPACRDDPGRCAW